MITAKSKQLAICRICNTINPMPTRYCGVCQGRLNYRYQASLQKVWAFWFAAVFAYIPGNLFPIMITTEFGIDSPATIIGGVIVLAQDGFYFIAAVVFFASLVIPVTKFILIAFLALSIQLNWRFNEHHRHRLHRLIEFVGRWSMIDVFVVAALAALVQLESLMSVSPGTGVNAFALAVILTMFSALSLDPRLIWDREQESL